MSEDDVKDSRESGENELARAVGPRYQTDSDGSKGRADHRINPGNDRRSAIQGLVATAPADKQ